MQYLVIVDHKGKAVHLTTRTMKGFKMCFVSSVMVGTGNEMLWNDTEEDGDVRNECVWKMKAMTVQMETVTLIGKGRQDLICFVYYVFLAQDRDRWWALVNVVINLQVA